MICFFIKSFILRNPSIFIFKCLFQVVLKKASTQVLVCSSRLKFGHHSRRHTGRRSSDQRIVLLRIHGIKVGRALLELWRRWGAIQHVTAGRCADAAIRKWLRYSNLAATILLVLISFLHTGVSVDHVFESLDQNERFGTEFVFGHGNKNKQENQNKLNYAKVAVL
jgi:hypothetical protein